MQYKGVSFDLSHPCRHYWRGLEEDYTSIVVSVSLIHALNNMNECTLCSTECGLYGWPLFKGKIKTTELLPEKPWYHVGLPMQSDHNHIRVHVTNGIVMWVCVYVNPAPDPTLTHNVTVQQCMILITYICISVSILSRNLTIK